MANGANGVHLQLREALEDYIKSQYFGKSPILLSAVQNKLDQEGILYQKPYIESSMTHCRGSRFAQLIRKNIRHSFLIKISVMNCGLKQSSTNLGFKISCKTAKRLWIF